MKPWVLAIILLFIWPISTTCHAQEVSKSRADDELKIHLESLSKRVDDPTQPMTLRLRLVMEMAAALDRAALNGSSAEIRRARWTEAVAVLDHFNAKNSGQPDSQSFQIQAGVYLWARARTWLDAFRVQPTDAAAKTKAVNDLKAALARFKPIYDRTRNSDDHLAQNARYRTAQTLADIAEVFPDNDAARHVANLEALTALERPVTDPSLQGFARLLSAELLTRLRRFDEAQAEVVVASKSKPAPSDRDLIDAWVDVLLGKLDYPSAQKNVEASRLDPLAKSALRARIRLAETVARAEGPERDAAETALFTELQTLRDSRSPETITQLIAAATALKEPSKTQSPEAWDLLAEGAATIGEIPRAGTLQTHAALRAEALSLPPDKVASLRLKAGAYFYQAEQFDKANLLFAQVADDPKAGPARPKAGLLRVLTRGRALSLGRPGATQADYTSAIQQQIKQFPQDPSSSEARWLLGKLRLAQNDAPASVALWTAIPHGHPRWLESRLDLITLRQHEIDTQRLNNDHDAIAKLMADARSFLNESLRQAQGNLESSELQLASARLELTPSLGRPEEAQKLIDAVQKSTARATLRDAARRLNILALSELNNWVEAEQAARKEAKSADAVDLLTLIRLLDRRASEAETDLRSRRIGYMLRLLLAPLQDNPDGLTPDLRAEIRLRTARALLFSGDDSGARRMFAGWSLPSTPSGPDLLRDLADTYARLNAYEMVIDVQRLRSKRSLTGSLPWFDARYGLAIAYYRSGNPKDALHLIDATAILHPDLGGGELREKFLRLRQRISPTN